jgi:hypothetical protein
MARRRRSSGGRTLDDFGEPPRTRRSSDSLPQLRQLTGRSSRSFPHIRSNWEVAPTTARQCPHSDVCQRQAIIGVMAAEAVEHSHRCGVQHHPCLRPTLIEPSQSGLPSRYPAMDRPPFEDIAYAPGGLGLPRALVLMSAIRRPPRPSSSGQGPGLEKASGNGKSQDWPPPRTLTVVGSVCQRCRAPSSNCPTSAPMTPTKPLATMGRFGNGEALGDRTVGRMDL